jgi:acetyltransferase-like isoleucine patch superfamily enzyme
MLTLVYKALRRIVRISHSAYEKMITAFTLTGNGVSFYNFRTNGTPYVMVARGGKMTIGKNFAMNNGIKGNPIGCYERCTFFVDRGCTLTIGDNVGISQTALIAHADLTIGDNVKIGGGTCIYTSDFHSLDATIRASKDDQKYRVSKPVIIEHDAFIGARCLILKGVTIGAYSIIGAGSVVTRSVPAGEIWAGNPARFIRKV